MPYLTKEAIRSTLSQIAAHPGGAEVAFDYGEPHEMIDAAFRIAYEARAARVAAAGEPFLSYFVPADLHRELRAWGFEGIDDLDVPSILTRLFGAQGDAQSASPRRSGGHVLVATTSLRSKAPHVKRC